MPSALAQLIREHKAAIAERIAAPTGQTPQNADERTAIALAQIDSMIGMSDQSDQILEQTLQELTRSQLAYSDDIDPAMQTILHEHDAVRAAILEKYPESAEALNLVFELERLTVRRNRAVTKRMSDQLQQQLQESSADKMALRAAVQELSTPIIPLYSGILGVPLVGRIDDARAQNITEQLLDAIAREQADIVLMDVTGISTMDTSVANHLMQTASAASLLGSQVVLVGISAEIAQTLVMMNVELGSLVTLSDLQSGVEYALEKLGMEIRPIE
ncbi:STAS domain-containing protein [Chloroflexia bacterium SDU3-3]|nr:STAS domain-containing protein [Chloroflexia bacterium SDU3-3]